MRSSAESLKASQSHLRTWVRCNASTGLGSTRGRERPRRSRPLRKTLETIDSWYFCLASQPEATNGSHGSRRWRHDESWWQRLPTPLQGFERRILWDKPSLFLQRLEIAHSILESHPLRFQYLLYESLYQRPKRSTSAASLFSVAIGTQKVTAQLLWASNEGFFDNQCNLWCLLSPRLPLRLFLWCSWPQSHVLLRKLRYCQLGEGRGGPSGSGWLLFHQGADRDSSLPFLVSLPT